MAVGLITIINEPLELGCSKLCVELDCKGDVAAVVITAEEVASPTIILPVTFFLPRR